VKTTPLREKILNFAHIATPIPHRSAVSPTKNDDLRIVEFT